MNTSNDRNDFIRMDKRKAIVGCRKRKNGRKRRKNQLVSTANSHRFFKQELVLKSLSSNIHTILIGISFISFLLLLSLFPNVAYIVSSNVHSTLVNSKFLLNAWRAQRSERKKNGCYTFNDILHGVFYVNETVQREFFICLFARLNVFNTLNCFDAVILMLLVCMIAFSCSFQCVCVCELVLILLFENAVNVMRQKWINNSIGINYTLKKIGKEFPHNRLKRDFFLLLRK